MADLPAIPTLEQARAHCGECARGGYVYIGACIGCQARHLARIPAARLRAEALEKRRADLGERWTLFRALARDWFYHDHENTTPREGKHVANGSGETPPTGA